MPSDAIKLPTIKERKDQLVACAKAVANLAEYPKIEATPARLVRHDLEIRRVLDAIVRRWTLMAPTHYISAGAAKMSEAARRGEHVVPCKVLVDRMIMHPRRCRTLLETAVIIASVTPEEHRTLGGIFTHHEPLYREMLAADVSQLPSLGKERYSNFDIELHDV